MIGPNRLLREQHGLLRHDQLSAVAATPAALRWQLARGRWRRVLPEVYATFSGALTDRQRVMAAWLYAGGRAPLSGGRAQIAGLSALRLHGLRYLPADDRLVHVLIPHDRRLVSAGFARVHRTRRLDDSAWRNGCLAVCGPARAICDAALSCPDFRQVRAMVAEVVQRGMSTVAELQAELSRARRNGSASLRRAVQEVTDGVRSAPEADLRSALLGSTVLPTIRWNPRLVTAAGQRLPTPDGWIEEVGIALEVDSREYHLSPAGWSRTLARHNIFAEHGVLVMHFPPAEIRRRVEVRAAVERAYLERRRTGVRPAVRTLFP